MIVSRSSQFATEFLAALIAHGVTDVVVCPGSRSQSLALAAAEAEARGELRLHVKIDERSAGFFALGCALETGNPAAVIVTSGTAVANLLPAVMEADAARVPLLLLTADRPPELHGIRSNQTVDQADVFARYARASFDAEADTVEVPADLAAEAVAAARGASSGAAAGAAQVNLRFREPLSGPVQPAAVAKTDTRAAANEAPAAGEAPTANEAPGPRFVLDDDALTVVVAGAHAGQAAVDFAARARLPLLAEVVSGARHGREAVMGYQTLLHTPEVADLIERVIVFGHPTLTREIPALLQRDGVEVVVVDPHPHPPYNPGRNAKVVTEVTVGEDYDPRLLHQWLGAWITRDRALRAERSTVHEPDLEQALATGYKERSAYARAEVEVMRAPVTRELLVDTVWRASWPHDRLVVAASRLVRVLDSVAQPRPVRVFANRGLGGIDGTIATALGIAQAQQAGDDAVAAAGVTRVIIGDLALLHDAGSLLLSPTEPAPRIQVIVGNDRGGTIFDQLEVAQTAPQDLYERVMRTPQNANLEHLAAAYGWDYQRAETRKDFEQLFTAAVTGPTLIEVPL